jgi:hypothetical protein
MCNSKRNEIVLNFRNKDRKPPFENVFAIKGVIDLAKSRSVSLWFCELIGGYLQLANQVWDIGFAFAQLITA